MRKATRKIELIPGPHEAAKLQADKPPVMTGVFLRFPRAMYEIARTSAFSAKKYNKPAGSMDYLGLPAETRTDALGRHLLEELLEGPVAAEGGILHAAQVAWNALARLERLCVDAENKAEAVKK